MQKLLMSIGALFLGQLAFGQQAMSQFRIDFTTLDSYKMKNGATCWPCPDKSAMAIYIGVSEPIWFELGFLGGRLICAHNTTANRTYFNFCSNPRLPSQKEIRIRVWNHIKEDLPQDLLANFQEDIQKQLFAAIPNGDYQSIMLKAPVWFMNSYQGLYDMALRHHTSIEIQDEVVVAASGGFIAILITMLMLAAA